MLYVDTVCACVWWWGGICLMGGGLPLLDLRRTFFPSHLSSVKWLVISGMSGGCCGSWCEGGRAPFVVAAGELSS